MARRSLLARTLSQLDRPFGLAKKARASLDRPLGLAKEAKRSLDVPWNMASDASLALLKLPKAQLLLLEDRSRALEERFGSLRAVFKRKDYRKADDLLFRFEHLPPLGKEYWFFLFSSTQQKSKQQLIVTAGRGAGPYQVNQTPAQHASVVKDDEKRTAAVVWAFDTQKTVFIDSPSTTTTDRQAGKRANTLQIAAKNASVTLTGAYPHYRLTALKNGKMVANVSLSKPKRGRAVEMADLFRVPGLPGLGIGLVNLYFDFRGTLNDKPFKGSCYVQKVVCVTPFAPWNWSRVRFQDGSTFEFFVPRVELGELQVPLERWARLTDGKTQRTAEFSNFKLVQLGKGANRRLIVSDSKGELFVEMSAYAVQPFHFQALGTFEYDEYLVQVRDFRAKTPGGWRTLDDLKGGIGILEDATGYLL